MTPVRLQQLDADRAKLGLSRGGALAAIYDNLGDQSAAELVDADVHAGAVAQAVQPLVEAIHALADARTRRATQRQAIGVHTNQIAKFANVLRLRAGDGQAIPGDDVTSIADACQAIDDRLAEQFERENDDDALLADARELLGQKLL